VTKARDEQPAYYAIIPANVRYDKRLKANAKLLYGEITALAHKEGYCWATDSYFAQLYEVGRNTVNLWIQSLKRCGYISIDYTYGKDSTKIAARKISIIGKDTHITKKSDIPKNDDITKKSDMNGDSYHEKKDTHITKNDGDNITRRNSTRSKNTTREYCADAQTQMFAEHSQNESLLESASRDPPNIDVPLESIDVSPPKIEQPKLNKPKKPPLTEREPKNDQKRVIKSYLLNFKTLYEQDRIATPEPVVNYAQTGKLIKDHLARKITVEQLIAAINRAMNDDFILESGYTLSMILSAGMLNRLLNSKATIPRRDAGAARHSEAFD
jgi:hypothetical protein